MQAIELTKLYYSIGEVADIFGVAPSLIRYWEAEFPSLRPAKNNRGERKYTQKDIETIKSIYHLLKEKGFTIEGAKKELDTQKSQAKEQSAIIKKLKDLRKNILNLRTELDKN